MSGVVDIAKLEKRMRPGLENNWVPGFLGPSESLSEVLTADERVLVELDVTRERLAEDLSLLLDADFVNRAATEGWQAAAPQIVRANIEARFGDVEALVWDIRLERDPPSRYGVTRVGNRYEIEVTEYRDEVVCPWNEDWRSETAVDRPRQARSVCGYSNTRWRIRDAARDLELKSIGLAPHFIEKHGFFLGPDSPGRVEPRALAELLELGPFATV